VSLFYAIQVYSVIPMEDDLNPPPWSKGKATIHRMLKRLDRDGKHLPERGPLLFEVQ
jgi:hypothetical protein